MGWSCKWKWTASIISQATYQKPWPTHSTIAAFENKTVHLYQGGAESARVTHDRSTVSQPESQIASTCSSRIRPKPVRPRLASKNTLGLAEPAATTHSTARQFAGNSCPPCQRVQRGAGACQANSQDPHRNRHQTTFLQAQDCSLCSLYQGRTRAEPAGEDRHH